MPSAIGGALPVPSSERGFPDPSRPVPGIRIRYFVLHRSIGIHQPNLLRSIAERAGPVSHDVRYAGISRLKGGEIGGHDEVALRRDRGARGKREIDPARYSPIGKIHRRRGRVIKLDELPAGILRNARRLIEYFVDRDVGMRCQTRAKEYGGKSRTCSQGIHERVRDAISEHSRKGVANALDKGEMGRPKTGNRI